MDRAWHAFLMSDRRGDIGKSLHPDTRIGYQPVGDRHRPIHRPLLQRVHRAPFAGSLPDSLCKQRMVLTQVRTHHKDALQIGQRRNGHAQVTHTCFVGKLRMPEPVVDVLRPEPLHQHASQVQLLNGAMRAGQQTDRLGAVFGLDLSQAIGNVFQRRRPVHRLPGTALLEHWRRQTFIGVEGFVRKAVAIRNPAFVDGFVLHGNHPHDPMVLDLNDQIRAGRIVRADRLAAGQFPSPRAVPERLAGQRTNGTQIDHVAGQLRINRATNKGLDLRMLAAVGHAEFHGAGHFLTEPHATGAVNAAAHLLHRDQRSHLLVEHHPLFFLIAGIRTAIADGKILQLTLTALVANGAVQWMIDQQKFHDRFLRLDGLVASGADHHALRDRCGAGRHRLGRLLHIHQTHPAVGRDAQLLVIAEVRNESPYLLGSMHHHAAFKHFNFLSVKFDFDHVG